MTLLTDALPLLEQKQVQVEPQAFSSLSFVVLACASFCAVADVYTYVMSQVGLCGHVAPIASTVEV